MRVANYLFFFFLVFVRHTRTHTQNEYVHAGVVRETTSLQQQHRRNYYFNMRVANYYFNMRVALLSTPPGRAGGGAPSRPSKARGANIGARDTLVRRPRRDELTTTTTP